MENKKAIKFHEAKNNLIESLRLFNISAADFMTDNSSMGYRNYLKIYVYVAQFLSSLLMEISSIKYVKDYLSQIERANKEFYEELENGK